jgi:hypothetical protein
MRRGGGRALTLVLFWIGSVVIESMLALFTFKIRLASSGMDADRAYLLGRVWQGVHLVLVVALIPGMLLAVIWRYLRRRPIGDWRGDRIAVAWLVVPTTWYLALMAEIVLSDTILPVYGICGLLTAAIVASPVFWVTRPGLAGGRS